MDGRWTAEAGQEGKERDRAQEYDKTKRDERALARATRTNEGKEGGQGEASAKKGRKKEQPTWGGGCKCCGCGRSWCTDVSARMEVARRWRRREMRVRMRRGRDDGEKREKRDGLNKRVGVNEHRESRGRLLHEPKAGAATN